MKWSGWMEQVEPMQVGRAHKGEEGCTGPIVRLRAPADGGSIAPPSDAHQCARAHALGLPPRRPTFANRNAARRQHGPSITHEALEVMGVEAWLHIGGLRHSKACALEVGQCLVHLVLRLGLLRRRLAVHLPCGVACAARVDVRVEDGVQRAAPSVLRHGGLCGCAATRELGGVDLAA
mmetsp:Transcript_29747/g.91289  ORF Transcript_29747/g.91289 Transcript_29747/m.91289 type:complete len:178 (-) Transcript_29747:1882-2415(-)